MPDVTSNAALDAAIGLAFVFFAMSLVCSAITEGIAAAFKLRARDLERGVRNLLDDDKTRTEAFFGDPRVAALWRRKEGGGGRKPSYLPPRVFALAFLDTLAPNGSAGQLNLIDKAQETVGTLPQGRARTVLQDALTDASTDVARLRAALETSFDEVMDRASGWYKRRAQLILVLVGLVVTAGANVDAVAITQRLLKDDAVRAAVVAQAAKAADPKVCPDAPDGGQALERAAACVDQVKELGLPLGWTDATTPEGFWTWVAKIGGLLLTVAALSLGAPFWFDVLGKLARVRGAGNREGTSKSSSSAEDRDDPSGLLRGRRT